MGSLIDCSIDALVLQWSIHDIQDLEAALAQRQIQSHIFYNHTVPSMGKSYHIVIQWQRSHSENKRALHDEISLDIESPRTILTNELEYHVYKGLVDVEACEFIQTLSRSLKPHYRLSKRSSPYIPPSLRNVYDSQRAAYRCESNASPFIMVFTAETSAFVQRIPKAGGSEWNHHLETVYCYDEHLLATVQKRNGCFTLQQFRDALTHIQRLYPSLYATIQS